MEDSVRLAGLDARTLKHIRNTARRVARTGSLPGMDCDDIEQDLILDLLHRRAGYDPTRASFRTFADRIIAHRVATLTAPTARIKAERHLVWLDAPRADDVSISLADTLPDIEAKTDIELGLAMDVRRFMASLSPALARCCDIIVSPSVGEAARLAGLHRSSVYEGVARLRRLATAAGLNDYIGAPRQIAQRAGK